MHAKKLLVFTNNFRYCKYEESIQLEAELIMESIAQFCKGVTLDTSKNRYAYSHKQNFA